MKKILSILLVVMVVICLVDCDKNQTQHLDEMEDDSIHIWTDNETGVQYLIVYKVHRWGVGLDITVRLNADGTPYIVTKGVNNNE